MSGLYANHQYQRCAVCGQYIAINTTSHTVFSDSLGLVRYMHQAPCARHRLIAFPRSTILKEVYRESRLRLLRPSNPQ